MSHRRHMNASLPAAGTLQKLQAHLLVMNSVAGCVEVHFDRYNTRSLRRRATREKHRVASFSTVHRYTARPLSRILNSSSAPALLDHNYWRVFFSINILLCCSASHEESELSLIAFHRSHREVMGRDGERPVLIPSDKGGLVYVSRLDPRPVGPLPRRAFLPTFNVIIALTVVVCLDLKTYYNIRNAVTSDA